MTFALLPALTLPSADPALAVRDIADVVIRRRLMIVTRNSPTAPALNTFLDAVRDRTHQLDQEPAAHEA